MGKLSQHVMPASSVRENEALAIERVNLAWRKEGTNRGKGKGGGGRLVYGKTMLSDKRVSLDARNGTSLCADKRHCGRSSNISQGVFFTSRQGSKRSKSDRSALISEMKILPLERGGGGEALPGRKDHNLRDPIIEGNKEFA